MTKDRAPVFIRDAGEDDTEGILRLLNRWLDEGMAANPARPRPGIELRKHSHMVVALEGDLIVGFANADLAAGDGTDEEIGKGETFLDVDDIYVLPERRGNGIGGALLEALLERGKASGAGKFFLEVESFDTNRALKFYAAHGFSECRGLELEDGKSRMIRMV